MGSEVKKITVITPSVRPEMLPIIEKCLKRQRFNDFEWLVVSPENYGFGRYVQEPPKKRGDYYGLNKAWNEAFKQAHGELIVSIQDGLWFPPDMLEKFWYHYEADPKAIVGAIGHQYTDIVNGKPENRVWSDPRARMDLGSFYEVDFVDVEWCVASIPKEAIYKAGGIDEEYDKYAALSEKDLNHRMYKFGYKFYLDQSIEYRAIKHPRLNTTWDERYKAGCDVYLKHGQEIISGTRLKLSYL